MAGTGVISADGGAAAPDAGGGGGGGRIALDFAASTFAGQLSASGGAGNQTGSDGTVHLQITTLNPPTLNWELGAGLHLIWTSQIGYQYQVLASQDLISWSDYGLAFRGTGEMLVEAIPTPAFPQVFFRVAASLAP